MTVVPLTRRPEPAKTAQFVPVPENVLPALHAIEGAMSRIRSAMRGPYATPAGLAAARRELAALPDLINAARKALRNGANQ